MKKLVWFMHVSLDGFVAGPNGEMDWIYVGEDLFDYAGARTKESDTALYGRVTWQMMEAYWPTAADQPNPTKHDIEHSEWYNGVQKVVLSETMAGETRPLTTFIGDDVAAKVRELKHQPGKEIIIFGSPSAGRALLRENLVDELWLFVNPVLLSRGIPMFPNLEDRAPLTLLECTPFDSGVVCLHYRCGHEPRA